MKTIEKRVVAISSSAKEKVSETACLAGSKTCGSYSNSWAERFIWLISDTYLCISFFIFNHILPFCVPRSKFLEPKWSHSYNYNLILYCSNHIMQRVISVFLYYFLHIFRITLLIFFSFNRQYK